MPSRDKLLSGLHGCLRKAHTALSPGPLALLSSPSLKALSLDILFPKQVTGSLTSETLLKHHVAEPSWLSMSATTVRGTQEGLIEIWTRDLTLGDFWTLPPILGQA